MSTRISRRSALEVLRTTAKDDPDRTIMTFLDEEISHTYGSFLTEVLRFAAAFRHLGIVEGAPVATMVPTSSDGYFAWLGLAWLRGVEIPVNLDYRGEMLAHILTSSGSTIVVCRSVYLDRLREVADRVPLLETVVLLDAEQSPEPVPWRVISRAEFLGDHQPAVDIEPPDAAEIASVVYTSGTTGPSKGVMVTWRLLNSMLVFPEDVRDDDFVLYSPWPLFHLTGKMTFTDAVMRNGSAVVRSRWSTERFWPDVREGGVTCALLLAGLSYFLWNSPTRSDDAENPLRHVQMAPTIPEYQQFEARFDLEVSGGYASSEAGMVTRQPYPKPDHRTIGRPNPEFEVKLVDAEGREVGVDQPGEALIRTTERDIMSRGYWRMPEATDTAWKDGWFHSGDGLRRDADGQFYFVDRVKDSIRRRGENVSSVELEAIVDGHPFVAESAAIAIPDTEVDDDIMIVVVRAEDGELTAEELWGFLDLRAPRFMVPRFVRFVEELPRTVTGRVRKVALRDEGVVGDVHERSRRAGSAADRETTGQEIS
ncbi:AMP-binding protein [Microbacterium sp. NPDC058062]|uniref:AMP-binding protein n=1 Tax=Microbacterium sp. NPDC058062 TaxID=3346320 RepID=UPI0036DC1188